MKEQSSSGREISAETKRFDGVELLRVFAAAGVIWFHIDDMPFRRVGYSGLIVFVLVTSVLAGKSIGTTSYWQFVVKRFPRYWGPWAFWFAVYFAGNFITHRPLLPQSTDPISAILAGPWIGLWYLPYAFVVAAITFPLHVIARRSSVRSSVSVFLAVGILLLAFAGHLRSTTVLSPPWAQWIHATPGIAFGLAIASAMRPGQRHWPLILISVAPLIYFALGGFSDLGLALPYIVAVPATAWSFSRPIKLSPQITALGSLCLGAYLLHGGLIPIFTHAAPISHSPYAVLIATVISAFAATYLLRKVHLLRSIV